MRFTLIMRYLQRIQTRKEDCRIGFGPDSDRFPPRAGRRVAGFAVSDREKDAAMNNMTLNQVLDAAMQLPPDQREMLVLILNKRQIEVRRREIATSAQESLAAYRAGELPAQSAEEAIRGLRRTLEDEDQISA